MINKFISRGMATGLYSKSMLTPQTPTDFASGLVLVILVLILAVCKNTPHLQHEHDELDDEPCRLAVIALACIEP